MAELAKGMLTHLRQAQFVGVHVLLLDRNGRVDDPAILAGGAIGHGDYETLSIRCSQAVAGLPRWNGLITNEQ